MVKDGLIRSRRVRPARDDAKGRMLGAACAAGALGNITAPPRRNACRGESLHPVRERRRIMTLSSDSCEPCQQQLLRPPDTLPHGRLMIVSSSPVVETFGGGVETRYVCLDCGYTVSHSTGRFGKGWH